MTSICFMRYFVYGDKESDTEIWPRMTTTFEETDDPDLGVPAEADDFVMDRRSVMALAKAKAKEEMAAREPAKLAAASGA
ncbi:unnamed protein product [Cuscuta europaea]|uniref:Uncharacterized protein n=1 Tax=Cuscuta europaea TaxID=41803 RepID=A0A9P0ZB09_CUSEU|nr:unnamed protein product [Cuscuta europaea]